MINRKRFYIGIARGEHEGKPVTDQRWEWNEGEEPDFSGLQEEDARQVRDALTRLLVRSQYDSQMSGSDSEELDRDVARMVACYDAAKSFVDFESKMAVPWMHVDMARWLRDELTRLLGDGDARFEALLQIAIQMDRRISSEFGGPPEFDAPDKEFADDIMRRVEERLRERRAAPSSDSTPPRSTPHRE